MEKQGLEKSSLKVLYPATSSGQGGSGQVAGFDLKKLKQSDVPNLRRKTRNRLPGFSVVTRQEYREKSPFRPSGNRAGVTNIKWKQE